LEDLSTMSQDRTDAVWPGLRLIVVSLIVLTAATSRAGVIRMESDHIRVEVDEGTGRWTLLDKASATS